ARSDRRQRGTRRRSDVLVSQGTPACLAASAARLSTFAAYFLTCSLCLARFSSACRCDALVPGTLSQSNGSSTIITVTLAPTDFANDNPFVTACSANSDPSVGMRICRYMLHLSIAWAIASDIRAVRAIS